MLHFRSCSRARGLLDKEEVEENQEAQEDREVLFQSAVALGRAAAEVRRPLGVERAEVREAAVTARVETHGHVGVDGVERVPVQERVGRKSAGLVGHF
jgi:hypothetical protein